MALSSLRMPGGKRRQGIEKTDFELDAPRRAAMPGDPPERFIFTIRGTAEGSTQMADVTRRCFRTTSGPEQSSFLDKE
jgi:hypothetical protein